MIISDLERIETEKEKETAVEILQDGIETRLGEIAVRVGGKRKLAQMAGVSESQLYRILAGESMPKLDMVLRICEAADASLNWLVTGEGRGPGGAHQVEDDRPGYPDKASMAYMEVPETLMGRGPLDREALSMALQTVLGAAHRAGYHGYHPDHTDQVADLVVSFYELLEAERPPARRRAMQEKLQTLADGVFRSHKDQG